jgi:hypothetical protein
MTIQYVSAFIDLYEDRSKEKSVETYCMHFSKLASSGIQIYLFLSESYREVYDRLVGPLDNVTIEFIELKDLETYKSVSSIAYKLPFNRSTGKDTANYMILMNSKIEFMQRVIHMNKTDANNFYAWIDFSIFHVFKDVPAGIDYLKMLDTVKLENGLYIPGCWNNGAPSFDSICWRFCGGFFIGDKQSVEKFYSEYESLFRNILGIKGLAWEVNVWAWLEHIGHLKCIWFKADHNDSIIRLPSNAFA